MLGQWEKPWEVKKNNTLTARKISKVDKAVYYTLNITYRERERKKSDGKNMNKIEIIKRTLRIIQKSLVSV